MAKMCRPTHLMSFFFALNAYQIHVVWRQASECGPPIAGVEDEGQDRKRKQNGPTGVLLFYGPQRTGEGNPRGRDGTTAAGRDLPSPQGLLSWMSGVDVCRVCAPLCYLRVKRPHI